MLNTNSAQTGGMRPQRPSRIGLLKRAAALVLALLIFWAGIAVGDGRLRLHSAHGASSNNLPSRLDYSSVNEVYQQLRDNYDGKLTEKQLLDGMKAGLADATNDPYTTYFTPTESKAFNNQLNNSFSGIGAELGKDSDDNLIVVAPISGFPADKAGLKPQDVIASIDKQPTSGMSVDAAVTKIRGKAGSKVTLGIIRDKSQPLDITITRDNIKVPSVDHKMLDNKVGYVHITTFAEDTSQLMTAAAKDLKQQGAQSVILDLRNNPGGLLNAAVTVSSQWLDPGTTILQEKRGTTVVQTYSAEGENPLKGMPTVVLVNQGSASASEITAGALHDNKAATIIGEKTYGKGVVQQLINLKDGGQLKVTVASWYRPNGQNINHRGITPDKVVKVSDEDAKAGNDTQKTAAIDFLTKQ